MSPQEKKLAFDQILSATSGIPVLVPKNIPVAVYIQEASDLYRLAWEDREALEEVGLSGALIDEILVRLRMLTEAEVRWNNVKRTPGRGREEFEERWREAQSLMAELKHHFHFAYRKSRDLKKQIGPLSAGRSQAAVIQNLNNIAVFGRNNPGPLKESAFDMTLLDKAAEFSLDLGSLLGDVRAGKSEWMEVKELRDRAYTYLKQIVDEVRACGRFVFRHDSFRKRGYRSAYLRRRNQKQAARRAGEKLAREEKKDFPGQIKGSPAAVPLEPLVSPSPAAQPPPF